MSCRERFLNACECNSVDRPPVWLMRQAGRALPEYRELRKRYDFLELVKTPELAAEVTLQPVERFGFDAAILFSDILTVPDALGQGYRFRDGGGIQMDSSIGSARDVSALKWSGVAERADYVLSALRLIRARLGGDRALIGFAGSPWTLANFMVEGGSSSGFVKAKTWAASERTVFFEFLEALSDATIEYLKMQISAGVDAVQIFDSLAYLLSPGEYFEISGKWIKRIIDSIRGSVPVIVFHRGGLPDIETIVSTGADVLSVDWTVSLEVMRRVLPADISIQGNMNPGVLETHSPEQVASETRRILNEMNGRRGYVFNLGHGLKPSSRIENIAKMLETIRGFAWEN
ncbi:MAG: uroporphyrinogen decarboxylase [Verrucomicrobia bacterium]|nr:uroporphyrinogen decarboxylase [Verrucomicrobiota bacterium]MCF7709105.1 uroporphyrinogen decarboxylase [Verrucomicrobiota bacterium]